LHASVIDRLENHRYSAKQQVSETISHVSRSSNEYTCLNIADQRGFGQLKLGRPRWLNLGDRSYHRLTDDPGIGSVGNFHDDTLADGRPADS